jgi:hypothetical protein
MRKQGLMPNELTSGKAKMPDEFTDFMVLLCGVLVCFVATLIAGAVFHV